jgi:putative transposase
MKARYRYRIYPSKQQQTKLARLFGCCRVVWNDALALCRQSEKFPKNGDLQKICITQAKQSEEREWLAEVSNIPLQQAVRDLGSAFSNFFKSLKGERQGKAVGAPKFKKKNNRQTARFRKGGFRIKKNKVFLAKIGNLRVKWSRLLPSEPTSLDRKIRREQRKLARRPKDSRRRERIRLRVAKLQAKIRDLRQDFLHKLSTRVIQDNQLIALEDLNVSGMVKNRKLSRAISQAGWREFRAMCEAKAERFNRELQVISRWQPTSQYCSACGFKWGKLDLSVRELVCMGCGQEIDRDGNASENLENVGVGHTHDAKRIGSECKTSSEDVRDELSTHLEYEQLSLFDC